MPVPSTVVPGGKTREEFTHVRYTACTVDPDEFVASKYSLRPFLYGRKTELFIVMTMWACAYVFGRSSLNWPIGIMKMKFCSAKP
jgi:hypothetical protein